jgi:hypothetical protein
MKMGNPSLEPPKMSQGAQNVKINAMIPKIAEMEYGRANARSGPQTGEIESESVKCEK